MFKNCLKINFILKRQAGHSKWANIRHTKELHDRERGKLFTKLSHQIKLAVRDGGSPNPALNSKLDQLIKQAKRMNMPVGTINSTIKSTQADKSQLKDYKLDIKGPGNSFIICELLSSNIVKSKNSITGLMKRHLCKHSETGSGHYFDHKGFIETELPTLENKTKEEIVEIATNHAIECDAEDVELVEEMNILNFVCNTQNFYQVQKKLEELDYKITNANLHYIPNLIVTLSDSDVKLCNSFLKKLEEFDDVVTIYHNLS